MTQIASHGKGTFWGKTQLASGPSDPHDSPLLATFLEKRENLVLFLAARLRSLSAAEDLVQDLYLKVAQTPADADVRAPAALLYRMATNLMVDQLRSAQRSSRRDGQWRM